MPADRVLTVGKCRALQRCSTPDGLFHILAIDHQDALKRSMRPDAPEEVMAADLTQFKLEVTRHLLADASGILLDPLYGAAQAITTGLLHQAGLLVELEKADYQMQPMPLNVEIDPHWSVAKIRRMGADGVKLFFYYNPQQAEHAEHQMAIVRRVALDCAKADLPFFAEPIIYQTEKRQPKLELVIESARHTAAAGADILKLEFPLEADEPYDEQGWLEACQRLTRAIDVPWVLLSAGVPFEVFAQQVKAACKGGASGFIVGRALWGDAALIQDTAQRQQWLQTNGKERLRELCAITARYGRPWQDLCEAPLITPDWFRHYGEDTE